MCKEIDLQNAMENNDVNKIKKYVKAGGNIYKRLNSTYLRETLMNRALIAQNTEIIEILLDVYERDYKIAEKFVSKEKDKDFLLKYIFIASNEDEIKEVIEISKTTQLNLKKSLVFLSDRQECVLASIVHDKNLMFKLYKNGFLNINTLSTDYVSPTADFIGSTNRLDLLKRMVVIGLNYTDLPHTEYDVSSFFEKILQNGKCIGLIKYCLNELKLQHEDLLSLSAANKSIDVFEFLLEYVSSKHDSSKKEFLQKYYENNGELFQKYTDYRNYELLVHIFTVYNIKMEDKKCFYRTLFNELKSADYTMKILEIEKDNFDDLLDSIEMDTNKQFLAEIWNDLDKNTLKNINKNNVKFIAIIYKTYQYHQSQARAYFNMIDPKAIYDTENGNTALFIALEQNCEPLVRHLFAKGADLFHRNKDGHTTLTAACKYSSSEIVRFLLEIDTSLVNEIGSDGLYPLAELILREESFVGVFKELIKQGANANVLDSDRNTLLHNAVKSQNLELVKVCLDAGVDPSIKGLNENTALHLSAMETLLEIFDLILETGKVDIETKNDLGNTALHNVCQTHFPYFFFSFVEKTKPNLNALNNAGQSPIHLCQDGKRFKTLLEMGADTSIVAENGFPFYFPAAHSWSIDALEEVFSNPNVDLTITSTDGMDHTLLQWLPDIKMPIDRYFENENFKEMFRKCTTTAFYLAASTNNVSIIKYMFEYGEPQLEHKNSSEETPIFANLNKYYFHKDMLEYLIEKGANVNVQNDEGNTLLMQTVFPEGSEILLRAGASVQLLNKEGESALHHAAMRNNIETCILLLKYGADLNLRDKNDNKPSDLCTYNYLKDFLNYVSE